MDFLNDFDDFLDKYWRIVLASITFAILIAMLLQPTKVKRTQTDLEKCWTELTAMIDKSNCGPILLRLAWSDAVSFDNSIREWPYCGGVNGSIRFDEELNIPANAGLAKAISLLVPFKKKYKNISWADLIQMAGVISIKITGGPLIELNYGRVDCNHEQFESDKRKDKNSSPYKRSSLRTVNKESLFPCPKPPYSDGAPSADVHLRNVFYRLGLNNKDTVALCGAHTIGRAFKDRTGVCSNCSGDQGATKYTKPTAIAKGNGQQGIGMAGGCSWTKNWLQFDNSYFRRVVNNNSTTPEDDNSNLLWLPTDQALYDCPEYRPYFVRYAHDVEEFFRDYAAAHKKMSELGAKFQHVITLNYANLKR